MVVGMASDWILVEEMVVEEMASGTDVASNWLSVEEVECVHAVEVSVGVTDGTDNICWLYAQKIVIFFY